MNTIIMQMFPQTHLPEVGLFGLTSKRINRESKAG
jgi:hypothetical protein